MSDLAPDVVEERLRGRLGLPYVYLPETTSTQLLVADPMLPEGAVAVAEHQTAGRGRSGRTWDDAPGRAILCSVLLRPERVADVAQLSLVVGLAVAEAIESLATVEAMVKWPNDVLVDGRKVAGILLERHDTGVVCGIGINVNQHPDELPVAARAPAGSLFVATGRTHDRGALLVELLARLERRYDAWGADGLTSSLVALAERDALRGHRLVVGAVAGVGGGIAGDGRLVLEGDDGVTHLVVSGEVTLL